MKKILPISLAVLLALSMGGNVYQYINTQALQASYTATTAQLETQSAEIDRLTQLVATQAEEIAELKLVAEVNAANTDTPTSSISELEIGDSLEDELDKILEGGTSSQAPPNNPSNPGNTGGSTHRPPSPIPDDEKGSYDTTDDGQDRDNLGITGNPFA